MKDDPGAPGRTERVEAIPRKSIYRLSIYHRCLQRLRDNGVETVSSEALARAVTIPVIASGGVSRMEDLIALRDTGVIAGAISGRAIYDGVLDLGEALKALKA